MSKDQFQMQKSVTDKHCALSDKRTDSKLRNLRDSGYRHDAVVFTRGQLEDIEATIYDVLYANPRDAFRFLPMNTSVDPAMTSYSYLMVSDLGAAKIVADGAQDRNLVDVDLTKTSRDIYEVGSGYVYTIGNQEAGRILDFQLVQERARVAAQAVALAHNEYAFLGGSGVSGGVAAITGFLNDAAVNTATLTDSDWTTVTGLGAYQTVADMIHEVNTQSSGLHSVTDVIMTTFTGNLIASTLLNSAAGSQTVLAALRQNYPGIEFHTSASGTGRGAAGVDRCVAYTRRSDLVEYVASVVYDEASPDKAGFRYTVQSRGKMAGTIIRYPLSMIYGDITIA